MMLVFTCTKCDTRAVKSFSRQSYESGVVLVRCGGCKGLHLVADHLGWFDDKPFMLHEHADSKGQKPSYLRASEQGVSVDQADVIGRSSTAAISDSSASTSSSSPSALGGGASLPAASASSSWASSVDVEARTAAAAKVAAAQAEGVFELQDAGEAAEVAAAIAEADGKRRA